MLQNKKLSDTILRILFNRYVFIFLCLFMSFLAMNIFFNYRKTYISGIFLCAILIFANFSCFESKKFESKKIILICTLISIGTISRCAMYFIHIVKPLTAIIILSAVFLGITESFFVGSMSMFVSNIFLGQGPWTFWQMAASGLVGAFSSFIFYNLKRKPTNLNFIIVSILSILFIYSPIMNISSFLFMFPEFDLNLLITYLITCLINDISHIVVTIIILLTVFNTYKKHILNI